MKSKLEQSWWPFSGSGSGRSMVMGYTEGIATARNHLWGDERVTSDKHQTLEEECRNWEHADQHTDDQTLAPCRTVCRDQQQRCMSMPAGQLGATFQSSTWWTRSKPWKLLIVHWSILMVEWKANLAPVSLAHWSCQKRCPMKSLGRRTISLSLTNWLGASLHGCTMLDHCITQAASQTGYFCFWSPQWQVVSWVSCL